MAGPENLFFIGYLYHNRFLVINSSGDMNGS
jgi:hypothetical protein